MIQFLKKVNYLLSENYINTFKYQPFVQSILLHRLYPTRKEVVPLNGSITEGIDVNQFETFIKYFHSRGYGFIDEHDIINENLSPKGRYIYLTFDDGYYNNYLALGILKKYQAKATFYITTNHIEEGKSFWWDVVYRERAKQGKDWNFILSELQSLYEIKWKDQELYLIKEFGGSALKPLNDLDRPMTKEELRQFSLHDEVTLGNHTHNHLNTTLYPKEELIFSIKKAQEYLAEVSQTNTQSISYPYGFINESVINIVESLGYKVGITTEEGKNTINEVQDPYYQLRLKRRQLSGFIDMESQCRSIDVDFSIAATLSSIVKRKI